MAPSTTDTDQAQATFGRYAETPYDQMTPEQQEGYRILATAEGGELSDEVSASVAAEGVVEVNAPRANGYRDDRGQHPRRNR